MCFSFDRHGDRCRQSAWLVSILFFSGSPVANFGWEFGVTAAPEQSETAMLGLVVFGVAGFVVTAHTRCSPTN
jgi:hypothetical protein